MAAKEPSVRKDGLCVVCSEPLKTVERYGDKDAFCSSFCCREYHGTQIENPKKGKS